MPAPVPVGENIYTSDQCDGAIKNLKRGFIYLRNVTTDKYQQVQLEGEPPNTTIKIGDAEIV